MMRLIVPLIALSSISSAAVPPREDYHAMKLTKVEKKGEAYFYSVESVNEGFVAQSPLKMRISEGSVIKVAIGDGEVLLYIIDESGKVRSMILQRHWREL